MSGGRKAWCEGDTKNKEWILFCFKASINVHCDTFRDTRDEMDLTPAVIGHPRRPMHEDVLRERETHTHIETERQREREREREGEMRM